MTNTVKAKNLKVPPRKARLVAEMIKGRSANQAVSILQYTPNKSAQMISRLLKSAISNVASDGKVDVDNLVVKHIWVDPGPVIQAFMPRAQGRATPKNKRTSHISLIVEEK